MRHTHPIHPMHPCLHQRERKKVLFITATWIIRLVEFAPSHVIDWESFSPKQSSVQVLWGEGFDTTTHQPCGEDSCYSLLCSQRKTHLIFFTGERQIEGLDDIFIIGHYYGRGEKQRILFWKARPVSQRNLFYGHVCSSALTVISSSIHTHDLCAIAAPAVRPY